MNTARGIEADFAKVGNQVARPTINILFFYNFSQPLHARRTFFGIHFQSVTDGVGGSFNVVRIDQNSIAQLTRCPGEAAEDQYSLIVIARSDKLLGHEIHSVM